MKFLTRDKVLNQGGDFIWNRKQRIPYLRMLLQMMESLGDTDTSWYWEFHDTASNKLNGRTIRKNSNNNNKKKTEGEITTKKSPPWITTNPGGWEGYMHMFLLRNNWNWTWVRLKTFSKLHTDPSTKGRGPTGTRGLSATSNQILAVK